MGLETHEHTTEAIKARLSRGPSISYLREWVYGGIDGVVTTFAIVAGVTGANLSPAIVIILGLANLIGDGFSMAAGAYSSARTDEDSYDQLRAIENSHIGKNPEGEREELRQIYSKKGFGGDELEKVVSIFSQNREVWIDVMMQEEYGVGPVLKTPVKIGYHTFAAFVLCGTMPLVPFVLDLPNPFGTAIFLSAATFFAIGSFKSRWSNKRWWRLGIETLAIGMAAAGLAFLIGHGLKGLGL